MGRSEHLILSRYVTQQAGYGGSVAAGSLTHFFDDAVIRAGRGCGDEDRADDFAFCVEQRGCHRDQAGLVLAKADGHTAVTDFLQLLQCGKGDG